MEIGSTSLLGFGSRCCSRILILPFVLLCCPLLLCCLAVAALFPGSSRYDLQPLPGTDDFPPVATVPAIPDLPSRTPAAGPRLDPEGIPLFGSAALESGFSPDPYRLEMEAGGSVDTAGLAPDCGYTSYHPAFVLDWDGGAEPFLRLSFTPDEDGAAATLLVHTPDGEWLCETVPAVLDLPSASPGEYAIWAGAPQRGATIPGSLSISGTREATP
jgi:hypothetical protein